MAALRGFIETLGRFPAGLRRPETLMLMMAIFASFGVHMPPYLGLGALASYFDEEDQKRRSSSPVEVSFELADSAPAEPPLPEEEEEEPPKPRPKRRKPKEPPAKVEEVKPKPTPAPVAIEKHPRKQSITQKSDDPEVQPPPDARFVAEESRSVEEETVARVRDIRRDQETPEAAAPQDRGVDQAGGDKQDEDGFHEQGEKQGEKVAEVQAPQAETHPAAADSTSPARKQEVAERRAVQPSLPAPGTVIRDPLGSFTLAASEPSQERRRGRRAQPGQRRPLGERRPDLNVSWDVFQATYDAATLAAERRPKRRRVSGSSQRKQRWKEFRAAIENYVMGVRPGNTTALNAAADPFAAYVAAFHRHLHQAFARGFLVSLPPSGVLADLSLVTKVEIVVNPDGSLHRVGVVRSSGQMLYDFGAFNAVKNGEPYPSPPERIRSADGRVYMRWALHRNHSQCGTWNAEMYIVKDPPDVMNDGFPSPAGLPTYNSGSGPG